MGAVLRMGDWTTAPLALPAFRNPNPRSRIRRRPGIRHLRFFRIRMRFRMAARLCRPNPRTIRTLSLRRSKRRTCRKGFSSYHRLESIFYLMGNTGRYASRKPVRHRSKSNDCLRNPRGTGNFPTAVDVMEIRHPPWEKRFRRSTVFRTCWSYRNEPRRFRWSSRC